MFNNQEKFDVPKGQDKSLELIFNSLNQKYGKGTVFQLAEGAFEPVNAISTRSLNLDMATGIGGFPTGRIVELIGPPSSGKAQPLDAKVLTPIGWQQLRNIHVGDLVCTPDNKTAVVLGEFPQGKKDIYKITFSDGSKAESCLDHLWTVQTKDSKKDNLFRTMPLKDIMQDYKLLSSLKYSIPMVDPIEFPEQDLPIDPYILGLFLGDGSARSSSLSFASRDEEIVEAFTAYVKKDNCVVKHYGKYDYRITKGTRNGPRALIRQKIDSLGLDNKLSYDKFVPKQYLWNSISNRVALLQGLMDTDGSVNSGTLEFTSTSIELMDAVKFIVNSLGGRIWVSNKKTHYTDQSGRRVTCHDAQRASIQLPSEIEPFRLKRKLNLYKQYQDKQSRSHLARWISDISFSRYEDAKCILIDHPDHLYITDDFIVTHNTTICLQLIAEAQSRGGMCAFIDMEHALDLNYAKALGVDINSMVFSQPEYGEQALDTMETMTRSGLFKVIVLDSVAALVPKAELEADMEASSMGLQARLMSKGCRKLAGIASQTDTLLIFTNQIRMKIGIVYGSPETTPGGEALKFYASMRLDIRSGKGDKDAGGEILNTATKVKIIKNKMAPPFKEAEFSIVFGKGVDNTQEWVDQAIAHGIFTRKGTWFYYGDTNIGQGGTQVKNLLLSNETMFKEIQTKVLASMGT